LQEPLSRVAVSHRTLGIAVPATRN
jgi:hypothetical protein